MKATIATAIACIMGYYVSAQKLPENKVPDQVIKSFKAKYPSVQSAKWEKENNVYEAEFKLNKQETSISFDERGSVLEIESEISKANLPQAVKAAVAKDYASYEVEEVAKIETDGVLSYEVEVEKGKEEMDLVFDGNGKLLKKVAKEEHKN